MFSHIRSLSSVEDEYKVPVRGATIAHNTSVVFFLIRGSFQTITSFQIELGSFNCFKISEHKMGLKINLKINKIFF